MLKEEFEDMFRRHYGPMMGLARTMLNDDEEAADAVSDVLARVWQGADSVPADGARAWLLACVRHACINRLHHLSNTARVRRRLLPETSSLTVDAEVDTRRRYDRLRALVEGLSEPHRDIIRMKYDRRMTYRQMAAALGISEAAVYKRLSNALAQLKKALDHDNE